MKRTIYIGSPAYLKLKDFQLKIIDPSSKEEKGSIPIEDIGMVLLDHFQITISHQVLQKLMGNTTVLISCDMAHLPHGIMLPLHGHSEYSERIKYQIAATEPLKKQLWKQTVEAKILNQMQVLKQTGNYYQPMETYCSKVKSGDTTNQEGIAAQHYWKYLIASDFIRERFGEYPNSFFNFGYAILRSMVARAVVETGLLPVLGIFHKNKYNPFCLADDLMEPFRPMVDLLVVQWLEKFPETVTITQEFKIHILQIATVDVALEEITRPLQVALKHTAVSLYKCFKGEKRHLLYPKII